VIDTESQLPRYDVDHHKSQPTDFTYTSRTRDPWAGATTALPEQSCVRCRVAETFSFVPFLHITGNLKIRAIPIRDTRPPMPDWFVKDLRIARSVISNKGPRIPVGTPVKRACGWRHV
jgi:hypothetical protein